mmetsp:Transcript_30042/g.63701  ORF Transcript_30042/g.63701 Transcript_30042/m.63701 type:complete len:113 (-) Transcript_30042:121-459(-)
MESRYYHHVTLFCHLLLLFSHSMIPFLLFAAATSTTHNPNRLIISTAGAENVRNPWDGKSCGHPPLHSISAGGVYLLRREVGKLGGGDVSYMRWDGHVVFINIVQLGWEKWV